MTDADDVQAVAWLVRGAWISQCLRAMAVLGLADVMDVPYDAATLAERTSTDPDALERLLRAIADADLLERDDQGRWSLSRRGVLMRSDHPSGMRSLALMQTWPPNVLAWEQLADAVRSGRGTFEPVNGRPLWAALSGDPAQEQLFNAAMARRGALQADALREAVDLGSVGRVVDVGGGVGALLESLLTAEPHLTGVLADRPDVAAAAELRMADAGLADRCEAVPSDFFERVPEGGDAYVLSNILHDWTDEECLQILRVVHTAMAPGARLWVLERVLDPDPPRPPLDQADLHLLDLNMLVLFGARERTSAEYAALLTRAGFDEPDVRSPSALWDIVETRRR